MKFLRRLFRRKKQPKKIVNTQNLSPLERRQTIFETWKSFLEINKREGIPFQKVTIEHGIKACQNYFDELERQLAIVPLSEQWMVKDEMKKARNWMRFLDEESKKLKK